MNRKELWHSKLPLIVRNFIWLVLRNIIHSVDNLSRKNWKGSKFCQLCNNEESIDHLLFQRPIAVFMWAIVRDALDWSSSHRSVMGFQERFLNKMGWGRLG
jgi:hypothetical protein